MSTMLGRVFLRTRPRPKRPIDNQIDNRPQVGLPHTFLGERYAGLVSFPPIRPCLTMVASTSTIARTATNAVMSEIS
jgi:hypothetical protein